MNVIDEKTIPLIKPITLGHGDASITYTEITLREPVGSELEKASRESTGVGQHITLIALVSKMPRTAVERMSQRDLGACNRFLQSFSDDGADSETDGSESSPS